MKLIYPADAGVESMPRMCSVATLIAPDLGAVRVMTTHLEPHEAEYAAITKPAPSVGWCDAWRVRHGDAPHAPTFRLFDRRYGPQPIACDFVFVSEGLKGSVRHLAVDGQTRASDHQPVLVELG